MANEDDVGRLFSWLKSPDLRYREFADTREVPEAAAPWPIVQTGVDTTTGESVQPEEPPPVHETMPDESPRVRYVAPAAPPPSVTRMVEPPPALPAGERLMSALGRRVREARFGPEPAMRPSYPAEAESAAARAVEAERSAAAARAAEHQAALAERARAEAAARADAEAVALRRRAEAERRGIEAAARAEAQAAARRTAEQVARERAQAEAAARADAAARVHAEAGAQAEARPGLFAGYRTDREAAAPPPGQGRPLSAVFSRLSRAPAAGPGGQAPGEAGRPR